jgi:hypothetical protein
VPVGDDHRWVIVRRVADVVWIAGLGIAIPFSPVARFFLHSWPGIAEWLLVLLIAAAIAVRTIANRRIEPRSERAGEASTTPHDRQRTGDPPTAGWVTVVSWIGVVLMVPLVKVCLIDPLVGARAVDAGFDDRSLFDQVLTWTFLVGPYLVGLLVWWLARGVSRLPLRLLVATVTACVVGILAYGSFGYLPPFLQGLL